MEKPYSISLPQSADLNVVLVSFPMGSSLIVNGFLYNLIEILKPICNKLYVITSNVDKDKIHGNNVMLEDIGIALHPIGTIHPILWSNILQLLKMVSIQINIGLSLIQLRKNFKIVFFYMGGANLFFPVFVAKLLRKRIIISALGLGSHACKAGFPKNSLSGLGIISIIYSILEKLNFHFSDVIIVESINVVEFFGLNSYADKININGARFIDTKLFTVKRKFSERIDMIGYIGRLSEEKGVMNFVKSMPLILKGQKSSIFFIGGDGPLFNQIQDELTKNHLSSKSDLVGWIPQDSFVDSLNELKLLVLPSYSEGLPTIILEAMACGTPVLVTSVGGIPDIVKDGETGFIIEDNSPECIAFNVIRALKNPELENIAQRARIFVAHEFTYDRAVDRWKSVLVHQS